jgi:hypothetical protein
MALRLREAAVTITLSTMIQTGTGARSLKRLPIGLVLIFLFGGCGALRRPDPPIDRSSDPRILREVEQRLATEPALDAARIRVEVDGGVVVLYGSVDGLAAWQCAIRNAQLVEGVVTVVDYLVLARGDRNTPCRVQREVLPPSDGPQSAPSRLP